MNTADVLVLGGPPGAGKTTVSALIADGWNPSVRLKADLFWDEFIYRGWIAPWKPEETVERNQLRSAEERVEEAVIDKMHGEFTAYVNGFAR